MAHVELEYDCMYIRQDRPASSEQWLRKHDILNFITTLYEGDLHTKRVLSLANAMLGVLTSASLAIHAVGRGLAQAMGTLTKHGVKQVDRLLSNRGVEVWTFFAYWTPFIVGARTEVVVALDWTSFAVDGQETIVLSMVTGHGRATPLLWKTVVSSTLKGNQRRYEYEVLCRLREVLPAGVKVTVLADRGFGDCKLFYALTTELAFEYVIRLRGNIYVTNARGERRVAAAWVGAGRRARRLVGARVTDTYELPVGVVVCVHDPKMDEPWCLVASEATVPTRVLIRYYGKRWGIEAGFRDIKDMRFGMGLSSMHVSRPDRRDRLLLISALAIAVLSLLGAAGERIGYDRWLKANTVKRRTHSLFRQRIARIQRTTPGFIVVSVNKRRVRPRLHPCGTAAPGRAPFLSPERRAGAGLMCFVVGTLMPKPASPEEIASPCTHRIGNQSASPLWCAASPASRSCGPATPSTVPPGSRGPRVESEISPSSPAASHGPRRHGLHEGLDQHRSTRKTGSCRCPTTMAGPLHTGTPEAAEHRDHMTSGGLRAAALAPWQLKPVGAGAVVLPEETRLTFRT